MLRITLIAVLVLSFFYLVKAGTISWQYESDEKEIISKKAESNQKLLTKKISFYPAVSDPLPDLNEGYLFSESRQAEVVDSVGITDSEAADSNIDLDVIMYTGSIITPTARKGIVTYQVKEKVVRRGSSRIRGKVAITKSENKLLVLGDSIDGYEVNEILPEKIVFVKGEDTVEKPLYDPDKVRKTPPQPARKKKKAATVKKPTAPVVRTSPGTKATAKSPVDTKKTRQPGIISPRIRRPPAASRLVPSTGRLPRPSDP